MTAIKMMNSTASENIRLINGKFKAVENGALVGIFGVKNGVEERTFPIAAAAKEVAETLKFGYDFMAVVENGTVTYITANGAVGITKVNAFFRPKAEAAIKAAVEAGKIPATTPIDLNTVAGAEAAGALLESIGDAEGAKAAKRSVEEEYAFIGYINGLKFEETGVFGFFNFVKGEGGYYVKCLSPKKVEGEEPKPNLADRMKKFCKYDEYGVKLFVLASKEVYEGKLSEGKLSEGKTSYRIHYAKRLNRSRPAPKKDDAAPAATPAN